MIVNKKKSKKGTTRLMPKSELNSIEDGATEIQENLSGSL